MSTPKNMGKTNKQASDTKCWVCLERDASVRFESCGHTSCCETCSNQPMMTRCPKCNVTIEKKSIGSIEAISVAVAARFNADTRTNCWTRVLKELTSENPSACCILVKMFGGVSALVAAGLLLQYIFPIIGNA